MSEATSPTLLSCTPEEGARRLAIRWIDDAIAAGARALEGGDGEALHDLRVALRKLRTVLRTYRDALRKSVKRKHRERLRELVGSTGQGRDAEVQLAWLEETAPSIEPHERAGAEWLRERLADRKEIAYLRLRSATGPALLELLPKLRRDLERYAIERVVHQPPDDRRFADVTAELLRVQTEELRDALRRVRSIEDEELAHEARIHGKRLRYLLEPLRDEVADAKEVTKTLKTLQDLLGELNDVAVRTRALRAQIDQAALERARQLASQAASDRTPAGPSAEGAGRGAEEQGLLALIRRTHQRRVELYETLAQQWIAERSRLDELVAKVEALAGSLSVVGAPAGAAASGLPQEIERKYLLSRLPPHVEKTEPIEIDQGYLPGEKLNERVRRMRGAGEERWYRCVKLGKGIARIEIEEETSRAIYSKLWPLTKGRRVRKRRYEVEDGGFLWQIDEFVDRELYLCEVELEAVDVEVTLPAWLAPHVVREVTGDSSYVNLNLAK
jgi:CHAD domain-containing protein/CYTH domain-containing protein